MFGNLLGRFRETSCPIGHRNLGYGRQNRHKSHRNFPISRFHAYRHPWETETGNSNPIAWATLPGAFLAPYLYGLFCEREIWIKYKDNKNFVMAGIDLKESKAIIEKFTAKTGVTYPILLDPDGSIFELYAEKDAGVTRNVLIDKDGKIAYLTRLFNPEEFNALKVKLESLLGSGISDIFSIGLLSDN
jgi:AhpC/TSA family